MNDSGIIDIGPKVIGSSPRIGPLYFFHCIREKYLT